MSGKRQFSSGYLLLEVFWIASALGLTILVVTPGHSHQNNMSLAVAIVVCWGTAFGGLFGQMRIGAALGLFLILGMLAMMANGGGGDGP